MNHMENTLYPSHSVQPGESVHVIAYVEPQTRSAYVIGFFDGPQDTIPDSMKGKPNPPAVGKLTAKNGKWHFEATVIPRDQITTDMDFDNVTVDKAVLVNLDQELRAKVKPQGLCTQGREILRAFRNTQRT
jgi:hypothetical protein